MANDDQTLTVIFREEDETPSDAQGRTSSPSSVSPNAEAELSRLSKAIAESQKRSFERMAQSNFSSDPFIGPLSEHQDLLSSLRKTRNEPLLPPPEIIGEVKESFLYPYNQTRPATPALNILESVAGLSPSPILAEDPPSPADWRGLSTGVPPPPVDPVPTSPGGPTGGGSGSTGGGGGLFGGALGPFGALFPVSAKLAMGFTVLGAAVEIIQTGFKKMIDTVEAVDSMLQDLASTGSSFSPELAFATANREINELFSRISQAQELASPLSEFINQRSEIDKILIKIETDIAEMLLPLATDIAEDLGDILKVIRPITKLLVDYPEIFTLAISGFIDAFVSQNFSPQLRILVKLLKQIYSHLLGTDDKDRDQQEIIDFITGENIDRSKGFPEVKRKPSGRGVFN